MKLKTKAWAVVRGKKLLLVRATKESAFGHWADLTNSFTDVYEVIPCEIVFTVPQAKRRK